MSTSSWVLTIVIIAAWVGFNVWLRRYSKRKMAEIGKTEEYKVNTARFGAVLFPLFGLVMIAIVVSRRSTMPPGNEPVAWSIAGTGVAFILYGLFKWYRLKHRQ